MSHQPHDESAPRPDGSRPGSFGPDSTVPGSHAPGSYGPGSYGPGSYGPGSYGPGSYGPGSYGASGPGAAGPATYGPGAFGSAPGAAGPYPGMPAPVSDSTERSVAVLAHLSTLVATLISAGWLTFVGPLIIWVLYKDKSPFARQAAAGAFNFALACWIASVVAWVAMFTIIGIPLTIVLGIALAVVTILFPILGAVRANRGEVYRYPFKIQVLD